MEPSDHIVAVFGGAVSGAEAAFQLTQRGVRVVVFDQNILPYGKIEDGLPKWHVKLRDKEEARIDEKLDHPLVTYVPKTRLGKDIRFEEVVHHWEFSAILLATGAWKDRPLPVPGVDAFVGKGLYYQNPFVYWYNHKHEPDFQGPHFGIRDGAIIVGGGLASLDVAKILMFETVEQALRDRGLETDLFTLDRSIAAVLEEHQLTLNDLGLKGCTLFYRRRIQDMPLSPLPVDTPEQLARAEKTREKILLNYQSKYLFRVMPSRMPVDMIVENERLAGLIFQHTRVENGGVVPVPGSDEKVLAPLIISSIGSIPEVIKGIPMDGQVYRILGHECCRIEGFENVFALGNAVTGRGNINESLKHGRQVSQTMADSFLQSDDIYEEGYRRTESDIKTRIYTIAQRLNTLSPPSPEQACEIFKKVEKLQQMAGYDGNYKEWIANHRPVRLEELKRF